MKQDFATPQDALIHFGVKGMKWGVRKADSPAGRAAGAVRKSVKSTKTFAADQKDQLTQKRIQSSTQKAAKTQGLIDEIRSAPTAKLKTVAAQRNERVKELETYRDRQLKNAADIRAGRLTDRQKTALKGAAVVGGLLLAYGAYKYLDSGTVHQDMARAQEFLTGKPFAWKKNSLLSSKMTADEIQANVVRQINPGYGERGTKMNCQRTTYAYELRRRGYDIQATKSVSASGQTVAGVLNATDPNSKLKTNPISVMVGFMKEQGTPEQTGPLTRAMSESGWGRNKIASEADFSGTNSLQRASTIFNVLGKHPEGARGELGMGWTVGGGHQMSWEIIGGKPVIFDGQTGDKYSSPDSFLELSNYAKGAGFTRLDNIPLNENFLRRWVKNAN